MTRSDIGSLCAQPLLPFYANSFETLLFTGAFVMVSVFFILSADTFSHFFQDVNLDIQCYQCLYIADTLCLSFVLKLYIGLRHVLKIWMCLG